MTSRSRQPRLHSMVSNRTKRRAGIRVNAQGSASFMARVGSALLCSLLASFSADVSCKSVLWVLEPRDLSDRKLKLLDFRVCAAGLCCEVGVCFGGKCCGGIC